MHIGKKPPFQGRLFGKVLLTWAPDERVLRIGRICWQRGRMMHGGYSAKFSLALTPRLFSWHKGYYSYVLTLLGVRLHYMRSYGGLIP